MKITSFNPMIVTQNADDLIGLFEALGFARRHKAEGLAENSADGIRMSDSNGFHIDIVDDPKVEYEHTLIRMNVDDFDEAAELLKSHGFEPVPLSVVEETYMKATVFKSPSGFEINLIQHKREK